jgi:hypothetical protein
MSDRETPSWPPQLLGVPEADRPERPRPVEHLGVGAGVEHAVAADVGGVELRVLRVDVD